MDQFQAQAVQAHYSLNQKQTNYQLKQKQQQLFCFTPCSKLPRFSECEQSFFLSVSIGSVLPASDIVSGYKAAAGVNPPVCSSTLVSKTLAAQYEASLTQVCLSACADSNIPFQNIPLQILTTAVTVNGNGQYVLGVINPQVSVLLNPSTGVPVELDTTGGPQPGSNLIISGR